MALCPHFISEYFSKVKEIFAVYQPQINQQVCYSKISHRLLERAVISYRDHEEITHVGFGDGENNNSHQMQLLIKIVERRIGGFERIIMIMMEENCSPWLTEELFNAYLRHVVAYIKKLKAVEKCDCPEQPSSSWLVSKFSEKWSQFLQKVDTCVYDVGTSIGFLDQTIYPNKNLLAFINNKLPIRRITRTSISAVGPSASISPQSQGESCKNGKNDENGKSHSGDWWTGLSLGNFPLPSTIPPVDENQEIHKQLSIIHNFPSISGGNIDSSPEGFVVPHMPSDSRLIYEILAMRIHQEVGVTNDNRNLRLDTNSTLHALPLPGSVGESSIVSNSNATAASHPPYIPTQVSKSTSISSLKTTQTNGDCEEENSIPNYFESHDDALRYPYTAPVEELFEYEFDTSDFEWDYQDFETKEESETRHNPLSTVAVDQATQTPRIVSKHSESFLSESNKDNSEKMNMKYEQDPRISQKVINSLSPTQAPVSDKDKKNKQNTDSRKTNLIPTPQISPSPSPTQRFKLSSPSSPKTLSPAPRRPSTSTSSPFNCTGKQRLSPSEYTNLQKTIEWANRRDSRKPN